MTRYSFVTDAATARLAASRLITAGAYVEVAPIEDGQVAVSVDEVYRNLLDQAAAEVLLGHTSISVAELLADRWNTMCVIFEQIGLELKSDGSAWKFSWAGGHEGKGFQRLDETLWAAFSGARVVFAGEP